MSDYRTLYEVTGDIKDVNTLLVPLHTLRSGFMCLVDFEHELGYAKGGNRIYPVAEEVNADGAHASCGTAEVGVLLLRVAVEPADYSKEDA